MKIITSKISLCFAPVPKNRLVDAFEHRNHRVLKGGSIQVLSPQGGARYLLLFPHFRPQILQPSRPRASPQLLTEVAELSLSSCVPCVKFPTTACPQSPVTRVSPPSPSTAVRTLEAHFPFHIEISCHQTPCHRLTHVLPQIHILCGETGSLKWWLRFRDFRTGPGPTKLMTSEEGEAVLERWLSG